jgi:hypothetical protein
VSEPTTSRVSSRYRNSIEALRGSIYALTEGSARDVLLDQLDDLAGLIGMGFAPLEEVPLSVAVAELDAERARARAEQEAWDAERLAAARSEAGIASLLDDTAGVANSDRDHRSVA